jgi:transposase
LMIDRTTISAVAAELGVSWHTVGSIAMRATSGLIAAYADPNRRRGTKAMTRLIESIRRGVPAGLEELAQLGVSTSSRRRADILVFFDHHASNGPTEAINGRLEALRRNALGSRNLTNYCRRSLLHSGALHSLVKAL